MSTDELTSSTEKLSLDESSQDKPTSSHSTLIKLLSKDNRDFPIQRSHAFISTMIRAGLENDPTATEFPLPAVRGDVLQRLVEYMQHHKGSEPPIVERPLRSKVMAEVCKDKWDAEFIDKIGENRQLLYDLILAANYLDIKSLLHLGCAKVASLIKGQPLESLKNILAVHKKTEEKKSESQALAAK